MALVMDTDSTGIYTRAQCAIGDCVGGEGESVLVCVFVGSVGVCVLVDQC